MKYDLQGRRFNAKKIAEHRRRNRVYSTDVRTTRQATNPHRLVLTELALQRGPA